MVKISPKLVAEAIYKATLDKSGEDLKTALARSVVLIQNKRLLGKSEEILRELQNIVDKKTHTVRMKVTSARRLANTEKHELTEEIKKKYHAQEVISEFFERDDLLGGMRVEVGEEILDTTYRNKLNMLSKFLTEVK